MLPAELCCKKWRRRFFGQKRNYYSRRFRADPGLASLCTRGSRSATKSRLTLCRPMDCSTPGCSVLHYLPSSLRVMSIGSVMLSNHLILFWSSIFPSIRICFCESALRIRWPEYWSFSFGISPFSEYAGLISFRMDWLDLLAVQGALKSLLQHRSSKVSILQHSALHSSRAD